MTSQSNTRPSLCIDLKKNRIRIHKRTLKLIGNPEYIQLLVNPTDARIAIRRSTRGDHLAHRICNSSDESVELYSACLIENLTRVNDGLSGKCCYRLYGNVDARSEAVLFSMREPILITESEEDLCVN